MYMVLRTVELKNQLRRFSTPIQSFIQVKTPRSGDLIWFGKFMKGDVAMVRSLAYEDQFVSSWIADGSLTCRPYDSSARTEIRHADTLDGIEIIVEYHPQALTT